MYLSYLRLDSREAINEKWGNGQEISAVQIRQPRSTSEAFGELNIAYSNWIQEWKLNFQNQRYEE